MKCPICNKEVHEEEGFYEKGYYNSRSAEVGCEKCGLYVFDTTLRKARNKWKKLLMESGVCK